jgi:hypothetical protein
MKNLEEAGVKLLAFFLTVFDIPPKELFLLISSHIRYDRKLYENFIFYSGRLGWVEEEGWGSLHFRRIYFSAGNFLKIRTVFFRGVFNMTFD